MIPPGKQILPPEILEASGGRLLVSSSNSANTWRQGQADHEPIDAMELLLLNSTLAMSGGTQQGRVFSGDQAHRDALHQGLHLLFVVEGGQQGGNEKKGGEKKGSKKRGQVLKY